MRLLFVIGSLEIGGAELQMAMLASSLASAGHHCEVFALRSNGALRTVLQGSGIVVHNGKFPYKGTIFKKIISLALCFWKLWLHAAILRPQVLHAYLPLANFLGATAGKMALVPVIVTSRRSLGTHQDRYPRWKWLDRIANALSLRVSVNSRAVARDVINRDAINPEKLVCIYNGLDFAKFQVASGTRAQIRAELGVESNEFLWVKVANLIPYKGHSDLLQAFSKAHSRTSRLVLVGEDRGIQNTLWQQAQQLGLGERVMFLGRRSDIPQLLAAMDGYIMASHEEGFSNAILEAMAAGLPVIATDVGGNREALQDGKLGIIVPAHDPSAMSDAMNLLMNDEKLRTRFSHDAACAAQKQYSIEAMVTAYLRLYSLK